MKLLVNQAALTAAGIDEEYDDKLVFLMSIEKHDLENLIPNCRLELYMKLSAHGRVWKYKGEAFVDKIKMADAQWSATIVDKK